MSRWKKNSASACEMINDIGRQFIHISIMKSTPSGMEKGLHRYPFPKRKPHRDRSMACLSGAALKQTRIVKNDTIGQFNLLSLSPCMCTCIMSYDSSLIDLFFHLYWIFILWLLPKYFLLWCSLWGESSWYNFAISINRFLSKKSTEKC